MSSTRGAIYSFLHDTFYTYTTVKVVKIPNTLIAIINRILQFLIITYIALYIVWWKKGYQEFQEPHGTSVIKVKGAGRIISNDSVHADVRQLWDTAEYQIPSLENNAFFIATRQTVTYNQTVDYCASALAENLTCSSSKICEKDVLTKDGIGYTTGECTLSTENPSISVCEINAWCPEESTNSAEYIISSTDVQSFTVFLKTVVTFGTFNITLRNVKKNTDFSCRYDKDNNPNCPIIRIGDMLQNLDTNLTALFLLGGLIEIRQDWSCNFDLSLDRCYPTLSFHLLQSGEDNPSPGINYRYAQKSRINGVDERILFKVYGLRFVVTITGKSGQFEIVSLFVAIGSGIGFMVLAGIICDAIFMYFHKYRDRYCEGKFSVCEVANEDRTSIHHSRGTMSVENADYIPMPTIFLNR